MALLSAVSAATRAAEEATAPVADRESRVADSAYTNLSLRGRVVWLAEALQKRHAIRTVPEARERVLALDVPGGKLHPLVEDTRGRAFRRDERLRGIPLELRVRQYGDSPAVQVIRVFALRGDGKYELDYWCDICAIAMYELQPCDCCQGSIELRARRVAD
jgi:hypothetical protein